MRHEYSAVIFGSGKEVLEKLVSALSKDIADRFQLPGLVERKKIKHLLASAKIFLAPSRWESFGIAAGESLCMGCSIVGTPVRVLSICPPRGFLVLSPLISARNSSYRLYLRMFRSGTAVFMTLKGSQRFGVPS
jgi:glycosyltransferase involved in cell wall biosynthesis